MQINEFGYSSMAELLEDKFYQNNEKYHAWKDAKTAIDMNIPQGQVHKAAQERMNYKWQ